MTQSMILFVLIVTGNDYDARGYTTMTSRLSFRNYFQIDQSDQSLIADY